MLLDLATPESSPAGVAETQAYLAHFCLLSGDVEEASQRARAAEVMARSVAGPWSLYNTLSASLIIHGLLRDHEHTLELCQEGLEVARTSGHPFQTGPWHYWLGEVAFQQGRLDEGERFMEQCHNVTAVNGDTRELSTVMFVQAHGALLGGDLDRAQRLFQATLKERFASGDAQVVPNTLDGLGWVASARGDAELAARLLGAAQSSAEAAGVILLPLWTEDRELARQRALSEVGEARFDALIDEGRNLTVTEAVQLALGETESVDAVV
jgi:hypothetical protein